jgi:hypothetical protein
MKTFLLAAVAALGIGTVSANAAAPAASHNVVPAVQQPYPVSGELPSGVAGAENRPLDMKRSKMPAWESGFSSQAQLKKTMKDYTFFPDGEG